jgi:hypothetical protein
MFLPTAQAQEGGRVIHPTYHHLGDDPVRNWPDVPVEPEGTELRFEFEARANSHPATLRVRQRDIDNTWRVLINEAEVAQLDKLRADRRVFYEIAAGSLRDGVNELRIVPDNPRDDIAVGEFTLFEGSLREVLKLRPLQITVLDADGGRSIPARVSIRTENNEPAEIFFGASQQTATRAGIFYTARPARLELPAGRYRFAATRGMEWSRDEQMITLASSGAAPVTEVTLRIRHEVKIPGYIAADTHIHTLEISGHGDASLEERMITLAGEGVELAVATDHNHNVDYRPYQSRLELNQYFTPVVGNEVTTANGHFNAFPLDPNDPVPNHQEADWVKMIDEIRLKGARVVILNHPRWPDIARGPFGREGLNRGSGDRATERVFTFDAMELVNSTTEEEAPDYMLTDWFALLNRGERITAVGSSDSHTVEDPVGQGRTYIRSSIEDPSRLNVDELCDNILAGRTSVSLGIFTNLRVDSRYGLGELVPVKDGKVRVELEVVAPSWIEPVKASVYINGVEAASQPVPTIAGKVTRTTLIFDVPVPAHDAHLVCAVVGKPITDPGWKAYIKMTFAATNPVYLDADGDGNYSSPRESAARIRARFGPDFAKLLGALDSLDPVLGVQLMSLVRPGLNAEHRAQLDETLARLAGGHPLYGLFQRHLPARSAN